jgi:excisionase family DNA binding protein
VEKLLNRDSGLSGSPITKPPTSARKKFRPEQYMLCMISEGNNRRVFSPDFEFHFAVPSSDDPYRWTTLTLQQAEKEIELRLARLSADGKDHPVPKKWRTHLMPAPEQRIGIKEAAMMLGISESSLRRLADEGKLPSSRTHKGHRRFCVDALVAFQKTQI